jgi:hypothetical protein
MPRFEPIASAEALPKEQVEIERPMLDAKKDVEPGKTFEIAKDVAAFANHRGGTIVYGAVEQDGRIAKYLPFEPGYAAQLKETIEREVVHRCDPRPMVEVELISLADKTVVAVNVWPYIGQVVGVKVFADKARGGYGGEAFAFPVRVGSQCNYLAASEVAMFMIPQVRRSAILIDGIPRDKAVQVKWANKNEGGRDGADDYLLVSVDESQNCFSVKRGDSIRTLPLDRVQTVYEAKNGWRIFLDVFE